MKADPQRWTGYRAGSALVTGKGGGWNGTHARPQANRTGHGGVRLDPRPGLDRRHRDSSDHGQPDQQRLLQRRRRAWRLTPDRPALQAGASLSTMPQPWWRGAVFYQVCLPLGGRLLRASNPRVNRRRELRELAPNSAAWLSSVAG